MRDRIFKTAPVVGLIVGAALVADYVLNTLVLNDPQGFTPLTTSFIAVVVATPLSYWLTSQNLRLKRMRDDLTASVEAKQRAIEEAEEALAKYREADRLYRLLGDNLTDHVALWSPKGERIYSSPSIERITGYTHDEFMALPPQALVGEADFKRVQGIIRDLIPGGPPVRADYESMRKDGSVMWLESAYSRLGDGSNILLVTSRDINERKRLELDVAKALELAQAASAAKSDFLANMTHELRTPLTAIIGFAEVLRRSRGLTKTAARQVGHILDASNTLLSVVNDVLDFSRLEAGGLELDPGPFDPAAMASSCAALVEERAAAKGLDVVVRAGEGIAPMSLDGPRLSQVLLNFLSNAVKFTSHGSITVALSQTIDGGEAVLRGEVIDTGIGIAPENREAIFDRFSQADAAVSRRFGGTGLGLAISRRIIERMDGRIGVDSAEGQGSTFWFEVRGPLAQLPAPEAEEVSPLDPDAGVRLLLVEDNAVNRELIRTMLEPFSIDVETANDGVAGVEAMRQGHYDLVLMDVQMPVMDGLTATREIRAMEGARGAATPIVAMTANVLPEQIATCLAAGMDDHLGKPINPTKLLETVARWSGRTHAA